MVVFSLRVKEKAYEQIKSIAKKQARSLNKQIEFILYQYLTDYERVNGKIELELEEEEKPRRKR